MVSFTSYTIKNMGNSTVSTNAICITPQGMDVGKVFPTGHGLWTKDADVKALESSAHVFWDLQKIICVPQLQRNGYRTYYKPKNNSQLYHEAVIPSTMCSSSNSKTELFH